MFPPMPLFSNTLLLALDSPNFTEAAAPDACSNLQIVHAVLHEMVRGAHFLQSSGWFDPSA